MPEDGGGGERESWDWGLLRLFSRGEQLIWALLHELLEDDFDHEHGMLVRLWMGELLESP
jgi:hypothetical protein